MLELVHPDPQHVSLERAEPVRRPPLRGLRDAAVELFGPAADRLGELARERIDLALVQRGQRLAGDVPLVEEEQGRAPRLRDGRS